jgi:hypothetical protein
MFTRLAERARKIPPATPTVKRRRREHKISRDFAAFLALY